MAASGAERRLLLDGSLIPTWRCAGTANSGYQDAAGTVRTPIKRPKGRGHNGWERQASIFTRKRVDPKRSVQAPR